MDKTNQKILFVSFATTGMLTGVTVHFLIRVLAGAWGPIARVADSDFVRHGFPVIVGFLVFIVLQFNPKIRVWGDEVIVEIRKVVWPSKKDTTGMTVVVCIMVLISSLVVTSFDFLSGYLVSLLMK